MLESNVIVGYYLIGYFSGVAVCWLIMNKPLQKRKVYNIEGNRLKNGKSVPKR